MTNRYPMHARAGSILMVLIVVVALAIAGFAALFMSGGTARLDKRAELNEVARQVAQTAIEEVLVKISNNAAKTVPNKKLSFPAHATSYMYSGNQVKVKPVEVFTRIAERPEDPAKRAHFEELMTAIPGFAKDHEDRWWEQAPWNSGAWASRVHEPEGEGRSYYDQKRSEYANRGNFQDNGKIRRAFDDLPVLAELDWQSDPSAQHSDMELSQFKEKWDMAMNAVADRVSDRIDGCAGNPNYGVGAELAAFATGAAVDADSDAEEEFRETAQDSGVLKYTAKLVSLQTEAEVKAANVTVTQPVRAERIVQTISLSESMEKMRSNLVPYMIHHYKLTPMDFQALEWGTVAPDGTVEPNEQLLTDLNERYPDNPSPQVWPFQIATCLSKAQ